MVKIKAMYVSVNMVCYIKGTLAIDKLYLVCEQVIQLCGSNTSVLRILLDIFIILVLGL